MFIAKTHPAKTFDLQDRLSGFLLALTAVVAAILFAVAIAQPLAGGPSGPNVTPYPAIDLIGP